jgi:glycosyltransferase involved in cell wall biosynthesis
MPQTPPVVSVITVVLNGERFIEPTLRSVAQQTYPHVEHVIIDGLSRDRTLAIVAQYPHVAKVVSERDKGFYDAMSKGIHHSTGEYVMFINAGDELYAPDTLERMLADQDDADVYYGDTVLTNEQFEIIGPRSHKKLPEQLSWRSFRYGSVVCHQSFVVRRSLAPDYDLRYPRSGDIEWSIRVLKQARKIKHTHLILSKYLRGGLSDQHRWAYMKERFWILNQHFGFLPALWYNVQMVFGYLIGKPL